MKATVIEIKTVVPTVAFYDAEVKAFFELIRWVQLQIHQSITYLSQDGRFWGPIRNAG